MKQNKAQRDLVAHAIICAALCVGGWMMLVQPKTRALADLETTIAQQSTGDVPLTQAGIESLAEHVEQVKTKVRDVQARNSLAHDSARLYSEVMTLAEKRAVLVERLQPGTDDRKLADNAGSATRVDITARGEYESIALFLDDVLRLPGFMRPVSLSLQPSGQKDRTVSARVVFEAVEFNLPEALAISTDAELAR